jgi:hypothetical protein
VARVKDFRLTRQAEVREERKGLKISSVRLVSWPVSASEIFAELPKLSREERRRLAAAIFELEEEADILRDCDRRADEHFRMLDVMEEQDGKTDPR